MFAFLHAKPRWYHYFFMCLAAFFIRAATFHYYVQHEERYCQPDSNDYHHGALCIAYGFGMSHPSGQPMFWRTPGYPWYLSKFYHTGPSTTEFAKHAQAHKTAIWLQILLCSLIPLLSFKLAFLLTSSLFVAWATAIISVVHLGFVLASTFLLTDGLAMILFLLFLLFWFKGFSVIAETPVNNEKRYSLLYLVAAAFTLGVYTWVRPMGQFIALICTIMLLFFSNTNWSKSLQKACVFFFLFVCTIFPWMWRNHQLTGQWFFCPLFGLYFNAFNAPKILARTENIPLKEAHQKLSSAAHECIVQEYTARRKSHNAKAVCHEMVCMKTAWPVIAAHPFYFVYDWLVEATKTAFDLYASQLVAFAGNCFKWDPLVEYLDEKIKKCLYEQPMHWSMRLIAWTEFILAIMMWIGILGGLWLFVARSLMIKSYAIFQQYGILWLKTGIFIGIVCMQTGGFGYARLRLPIECLMLILGLTFWWFIYNKRYTKNS